MRKCGASGWRCEDGGGIALMSRHGERSEAIHACADASSPQSADHAEMDGFAALAMMEGRRETLDQIAPRYCSRALAIAVSTSRQGGRPGAKRART